MITIGDPHEQGLVFKWGSLVGISLPTTGATGTSPFVAGDVVFRPREFTTAITTWANVPYCETDFANYGDFATDHLVTVHNPATGVGDICRYMGMVDGARWRIPTQSEWNELYGSTEQDNGQVVRLGDGWVIGKYYPLSGLAMGAGQNYVSITYGTADIDARVNNADPWINGAVFLTASGYRNGLNYGIIYHIGSGGYTWTSTASADKYSHYFGYTEKQVLPQSYNSRDYGFPIRCIRE